MKLSFQLLFLFVSGTFALKINAQTYNYNNGVNTPTSSSDREAAERNRKNTLNSLKNNEYSSSPREKSSSANNNIIRTPEVKVNQYYTTLESEGLIPFKDAFSEKYGYVDRLKKVVIKADFVEIASFKNGYARVAQGGYGAKKYGYIDKKGNIAVPCIYTTAEEKLSSFTIVSSTARYGIINEKGIIIIPFIYESISYLSNDFLLVKKNDLFGALDEYGRLVIPIIYTEAFKIYFGVAKVKTNEGYGFIGTKGNIIVPCKYRIKAEYLTDFTIIQDADNKYGVIDEVGAFIIPIGTYDEIGSISTGYASVKKLNKWGAVSRSGKLIVPVIYLQPFELRESGAKVTSEMGQGFINSSGKEIVTSIYKINDAELTEFTIVQDASKSYGVIDRTGAFKIPLKMYDRIEPLTEGLACVKKEGNWGAINSSGSLIVPAIYSYSFYFFAGYAKVNLNGADGFIDKNGATYIPFKYRIRGASISDFMVVLDSARHIGVMDKSGNLKIPFGLYNNIKPSQDNRFISVKKNGKWGAVNSWGKLIVPPIYSKELDFYGAKHDIILENGNKITIDMDGNWVAYNDSPIEFNEGVGKVYDHNYGFIDSVGNIIVPCIYHSANNFHDGMAAVASDMYHWGFVNMKGEVVVPLKYERVTDFKNGEARVYKEQYSSEFSYVDKNGKTYRKSKVK